MIIDTLVFMGILVIEAVVVAIIIFLMLYMSSSTATTIMIAKLTNKKNLVRKIYPGSRLERLYVPKKANQDDIFTVDPKNKNKIDVLDGRMKTEFGSTMVDGIRIHTVMAGDMAPMGPEAAASATFMLTEARRVENGVAVYPEIANIRENHKITDLITADMEHLPDKCKKYVVVATTNKTKDQIKNDKDMAAKNLADQVIKLRGAIASHPYPVDYITAINAVLNPVVKGIVELIDIYIQKRQEDAAKAKEKMMQYGIVFCMVIGITAFAIIAVTKFV